MGYFTDIFEMNIFEAFAFHPILGIPIKIMQYALFPLIYLFAITILIAEYGKYTMIPLSLLCVAIGIILFMRLIRGKKGFGKKIYRLYNVLVSFLAAVICILFLFD